MFDIIVNHGLVFDGNNKPPQKLHMALRNGRVVETSKTPYSNDSAKQVIDATGLWVTPGFLDTHTHYDAELLAAPALSESVRHGVTTVTVGSCSISMIAADTEDCSDLFTRVESVPRESVLPLLNKVKTWRTPTEYLQFLKQHPIGPNLTSFIGHSDIRVAVMGLARAVDKEVVPTEQEIQDMESLLKEALDQGFLGLSTMTTTWDKLDGNRYRSASLPSTYARWREFRRFNKMLRQYGRVHQGAPDIVTKWNVLLFIAESVGLWRRSLKTTLISLMDIKANPYLVKVIAALTRYTNRLLDTDFRWQALPNRFEVYADGIDLVIFEEFGAGQAALHLQNEIDRNELMQDEQYRRWFRKDYANKFGPRVWQRDFHAAQIISCPEPSYAGKTFGQIADSKGMHPVDLFLDLVVKFGKKLRWHTVIANDREKQLIKIVSEPSAIISFSDSGAHIRNMAFYNFPLRFLQMVYQAELKGESFMSIEKAVWRLTGELADWFGLDAGKISIGNRADICILDPNQFDQPLDSYYEADFEAFGNVSRMVNRQKQLVNTVIINGRIAYQNDQFSDDFGSSCHYGSFLKAGFTGG